jgi:hypothetical protein
MQNRYESSEVVQIGEAKSLIQGAKIPGPFDVMTGDESTEWVMSTDIDE